MSGFLWVMPACSGKQAFVSRENAMASLQRPTRNWRKPAPGYNGRVEPYRCRHCHEWHVGGGSGRGRG